MKPGAKLSEIWLTASRELVQCRRDFGRRSTKTACAEGAILYYLGNPLFDNLNDFPGDGYAELARIQFSPQKNYLELLAEFEEKLTKSSRKDDLQKVEELNDDEGLTLYQFAKLAKDLGL